MSKQELDKTYFVSFCIEQFKKHRGITGKEAAESGLLNKQELIKELRTYTLVDQLLMHTEESLKSITFIEAKEIKL